MVLMTPGLDVLVETLTHSNHDITDDHIAAFQREFSLGDRIYPSVEEIDDDTFQTSGHHYGSCVYVVDVGGHLRAWKFIIDPDKSSEIAAFEIGMGAFNHKNIVRPLTRRQFGPVSAVEMDLEGPNLRSYWSKLSAEERTLEAAIGITLDVSEGLRFMSERRFSEDESGSVIHRDVKPENILIAKDESNIVAKVADFDIAGRIQYTPSVAGTIPYMSPEQLRGEELDARSDMYSLGVVLYELLAGKIPHAVDRRKVTQRVMQGGVVLTDLQRECSSLADKIEKNPVHFDNLDAYSVPLLRRLLSPDPKHRYASWGEFQRHAKSQLRKKRRRDARVAFFSKPLNRAACYLLGGLALGATIATTSLVRTNAMNVETREKMVELDARLVEYHEARAAYEASLDYSVAQLRAVPDPTDLAVVQPLYRQIAGRIVNQRVDPVFASLANDEFIFATDGSKFTLLQPQLTDAYGTITLAAQVGSLPGQERYLNEAKRRSQSIVASEDEKGLRAFRLLYMDDSEKFTAALDHINALHFDEEAGYYNFRSLHQRADWVAPLSPVDSRVIPHVVAMLSRAASESTAPETQEMYLDRLVSQLDVVHRTLVREDDTVRELCVFDTSTGELYGEYKIRGFSSGSCPTRTLSELFYSFALGATTLEAYSVDGTRDYSDQVNAFRGYANDLLQVYVDNLSEDGIPVFDFGATGDDALILNSYAALRMCDGLLLLTRDRDDEAKEQQLLTFFYDVATNCMRSAGDTTPGIFDSVFIREDYDPYVSCSSVHADSIGVRVLSEIIKK